ncbi:glucose-6-phosphate isomerase [Geodermatophilus ruber]|uniref:Glucose-6-phosphate isomerase n=1 Tax=Geodermatophilus ruber TaxID=504800 RepID=A0A1I4F6V3_9ACTN|nr:glucose-6-phosphate isomerase [Geodermatophilus ruber]SFL13634.1 glucose-6-phosphate isomerase [Geodermatophilus ruber]
MGISGTPEWKALADHHLQVRDAHLRDLFAEDPERGTRFTCRAGDLHLDFSKNRLTGETLRLLAALAERAGLRARTEAMFRGEHINTTEDRAVLHTALRAPRDRVLVVDGQDVTGDVHRVLDRMADFAQRVRNGTWRGHTGEPIRAVVNIGIGGSDLGPAMAYTALRDYSDRSRTFRFVSNIDPTDLAEATRDLDPATTLFIVCSKTFTTQETLANATAARRWLVDGLGGDDNAVAAHFVAVSTNAEKVAEFGIDPANMFEFWDWVGGRYSFTSAIGLSLMVAIGPERYQEMLDGFATIDEHFRTAPWEQNLPALLGLISVWYIDFFRAQTSAVLPYSLYLARFPAYLQQLCMESNGKSVTLDGTPVDVPTGEIVWGEPGTNGQHAFYQLLHQGTHLVPADFLAFAQPHHDLDGMHDLLLANFLAQPAALAFGRTAEEVAADGTDPAVVPHKVMAGNHPSNAIVAPKLTPNVLGQLVAAYEHRVFTQGVVWGINPFDQWGVELGKVLAQQLAPKLQSDTAPTYDADSSTNALVRLLRQLRGRPA